METRFYVPGVPRRHRQIYFSALTSGLSEAIAANRSQPAGRWYKRATRSLLTGDNKR